MVKPSDAQIEIFRHFKNADDDRQETRSNLFVFGPAGTGKTLVGALWAKMLFDRDLKNRQQPNMLLYVCTDFCFFLKITHGGELSRNFKNKYLQHYSPKFISCRRRRPLDDWRLDEADGVVSWEMCSETFSDKPGDEMEYSCEHLNAFVSLVGEMAQPGQKKFSLWTK